MTRLRATIFGVLLFVIVLAAWPATAFGGTAADANLIFIHHSVGSAWLSRGLVSSLNASGYHVADTNYGWPYYGTDYGSSTDTGDWQAWFSDSPSTRMDLLYPYMGLSSGTNTLDPAAGENTIVMFKSCYPNSDVGSGITDEQGIYNSLLPYFQDHPDKMFVLITPPPMQSISYPAKTRELCNWLTDRTNGWLKDLTTGNVFVFDFYNVLTAPGAHHYMSGGVETHVVVGGQNTLYYDSSGDDHPNATGDAKATAEFVPLLNAWYEVFLTNSGSGLRRVQQTDARITYLGDWLSWNSAAESGGSMYYAPNVGGAALVSFSGTTFELLAAKGPAYGSVSIKIDGEPATHADLYDAAYKHQQTVYSRTDLTDTTHTAVILCDGTKNGSSGGITVNIDAFRVLGTLNQAATPTRSQQNDAHAVYAGVWSDFNTWSASGGSAACSNAAGSAMNVGFDGTSLALYALKGPNFGKMQVRLDDGTPVLVDLYAPTYQFKKKVYSTGLVTDGAHSVSAYWTGQKNPASMGTFVDVDTFDVMGDLTDGSNPEPITWRYQQNDTRLTFLGSWSTGATWSASGLSFCSTDQAGGAVLAKFTGTSLSVLAKTAPWYGQADFILDGSSTTVDLYSASQAYKVRVFERTGLSPGEHTLVIKCCHELGGGGAGGYSISLDALDITGYLTQAPQTTRIQETDAAKCAYEGTWSTGTTWSASGGTFKSGAGTGTKVTVTFEGQYLSWLARATPWYGRARVTLDGDTANARIVDLYSPIVQWKKPVYSTGLLTDGAHTVVIEWLGTKYWASGGTAISVDAFDILVSAP